MSGITIPPEQRIILAADVPDVPALDRLLHQLSTNVGAIKIGLETHTAATLGGPKAIARVNAGRCRVMYDGEFSDIPNTMERAVANVANQGVWAFTVHANAGPKSLEAATKAKGRAKMFAVTLLTSIDDEDSIQLYEALAIAVVERFAHIARECGADGIICSPKELAVLRANSEFKDLLMITPGVRPTWANQDDQARVMTPKDAMIAGADYLVIGRPITAPPVLIGDSVDAAQLITDEIRVGLIERKGV